MFVERIKSALRVCDRADLPPEELAVWASRVLAEREKANPADANWSRPILMLIRHQADMRVAAADLKIEAYRIRTGSWPEKRSDLEGPPPLDPFTGKGLTYRQMEDGCIVYSVGENQTCDGGQAGYAIDGPDDIAFQLFDVEEHNRPTQKPREQQ
jgi:hypothetical protein